MSAREFLQLMQQKIQVYMFENLQHRQLFTFFLCTDDPMVNGIDDEKGPMKAEELWNLPYPKHT